MEEGGSPHKKVSDGNVTMFQFLAEAMVITAAGGVFGVLLSYIVSHSVGTLTHYSAGQTAAAGDIHLLHPR
jgi:ABC-type antimicrobial peptide transport system permease subunit